MLCFSTDSWTPHTFTRDVIILHRTDVWWVFQFVTSKVNTRLFSWRHTCYLVFLSSSIHETKASMNFNHEKCVSLIHSTVCAMTVFIMSPSVTGLNVTRCVRAVHTRINAHMNVCLCVEISTCTTTHFTQYLPHANVSSYAQLCCFWHIQRSGSRWP